MYDTLTEETLRNVLDEVSLEYNFDQFITLYPNGLHHIKSGQWSMFGNDRFVEDLQKQLDTEFGMISEEDSEEIVDEEKLREVNLELTSNEEDFKVKQVKYTKLELEEIDKRVGSNWTPLSLFFLNDDDANNYLEFLDDSRVFDKLQRICKKSKIRNWEDKNKAIELPIHYKDTQSGIIIGNLDVWRKYQEWKIANNFIKQHDKEDLFHIIGNLMLNDHIFSEYFSFVTSYHGTNNTEPNWTNVEKEMTKAVKRIGKRMDV